MKLLWLLNSHSRGRRSSKSQDITGRPFSLPISEDVSSGSQQWLLLFSIFVLDYLNRQNNELQGR